MSGCKRVILLIMTLVSLTFTYALAERTTVKVGFFAFPGYHELDETTGRTGYGADFLEMVRRYADLDFAYVGYEESWQQMLLMLQSGEIDMVTSAQKTDARETQYLFSEPIGTSNAVLSVRADDERYLIGDYKALDGITVGLLAANSRNQDLAEFAKKQGFAYTGHIYATYQSLVDALHDGDVDAILTSSLRKLSDGERIVARFAPEEFYVMLRKDETELLRTLNHAIEQMDMNEGNWRSDLYYAHYQSEESRKLSFTQEEQDYIAAVQRGEKTITAAAQPDRDPYSFVENGKLVGVIPDYFDHLMQMAGLPYTQAIAESRAEFEQWTTSNRVDVLMDCRYDRVLSLNDDFGVVTPAYMRMTMARVTRRGFTGEIKTVATTESQGAQAIDDRIAENAEYVPYATREAAMEAVRDGHADACYVYTYMAEKFVNQSDNGEVTYSILNSPTFDEYIYVNPDVDYELVSILSKCIRADQSYTLDELAKQYTAYSETPVTFTRFVRQNPWFIAAVAFAAVGVAAVILLMRRNQLAAQKMAAERSAYVEKLQQKNAELEEAVRREEKANLAKREFLFNMSHDIRTPMNAVLGFATLARENLDDKARVADYLNKILQSGDNLLDLINNVLEMSKIESGQSTLDEEICNVDSFCRSVCVSFEAAVKKKNISLSWEADVTHRYVWADATKLRQVLGNILSNAVKFTPEGGKIIVRVREEESARAGYIRVVTTVEDTGIGISKEFQDRIFDQFERERTATETGVQGSGLGLAIARRNMEMMGGRIDVESELGEGTRVIVTAEHRIAPEEPKQEETSKDDKKSIGAGRRILLAEDNELNAEIAIEVLNMIGFDAERASDGVQCVSKMEKADDKYYDLILMDIQMPNMNGYDATRVIRELKDPEKRAIPIVAMTANAFDEDKKKAFASGMDGFIAKPVDITQLIATLDELLGKK